MTKPSPIPTAVARLSRAQRRRRRITYLRERLPAASLGIVIVAAIASVGALVPAALGGAFHEPKTIYLNEAMVDSFDHSTKEISYCTPSDWAWQRFEVPRFDAEGDLDALLWSDIDVRAPTVPEIDATWSTDPGSKTTATSSGIACFHWGADAVAVSMR